MTFLASARQQGAVVRTTLCLDYMPQELNMSDDDFKKYDDTPCGWPRARAGGGGRGGGGAAEPAASRLLPPWAAAAMWYTTGLDVTYHRDDG
jgi:hypothetical protein